jgi:hypothetical protein
VNPFQFGDGKLLFEVFGTAPVVDAFKGICESISWQVMTRIIRVCHGVVGMMGSSAQIGLHAGCLASGSLAGGSLQLFAGALIL